MRTPTLRPLLAALVLALALGARPLRADDEPSPEITRGELQAWVKWLSSDDLEGREAGEPGADRAADRIAEEFVRLGLRPAGDDGSPFQAFTLPRGQKALPDSALAFVPEAGEPAALDFGDDFVPVAPSAAGTVEAEAVFAGYGVRAPEAGYDDYAGLDAKGKVVVVLRRAPAHGDRKSPFGTPQALARWGSIQAKAEAAAAAGAAALLVVNDPAGSPTKEKDELLPAGGAADGRLPVFHVAWRAARRLPGALDLRLPRRQAAIDAKVAPRSEPLPGVRVRLKASFEAQVRRVRNVVAVLDAAAPPEASPASAPAAGPEAVVVGAHYDHIGRGRFGSLAGGNDKIHNGADDNASGTASVLEIAGWLAARRDALRRTVVFVAFTAEELGLHGSKHYADRPVVPLADTVAMLNLDMVGRSEGGKVYVGGTGTSPVWPGLLELGAQRVGRLQVRMWPGGKAPSDHQVFYERGLPVLFFFTGLTNDYHRPSDDWNTLQYDGHARITRLCAEVLLDLASRPTRPAFTKCDAGGFEVGPYVGLSVDPRADGLFVAHVDDKGPARRAGVRVGDRIVAWDDAPVADATAWSDLLSKAKSGDKVELALERDGRRVRAVVTLGKT